MRLFGGLLEGFLHGSEFLSLVVLLITVLSNWINRYNKFVLGGSDLNVGISLRLGLLHLLGVSFLI